MSELKLFNPERGDLDEMVALYALGKMVREAYDEFEVEGPDWLEPKMRSIRREIKARISDRKENELAKLRLSLESCKTPQERKADTLRKIKELEAKVETMDQ